MATQKPDAAPVKVEKANENNPDQAQPNANGGPQSFGGPNRPPMKGRFNFRNKQNVNPKFEPKGGERRRPNVSGERPEGVGHIRGGPERMMFDKLNQLGGPSYELLPVDTKEKKFSGRSRLYIGNIPNEVTEDEINNLFKQYGETNELFINKEKNFGFIRMDYHFNAEKAKGELNGYPIRGRNLRVRFAPNGSTIKIKNLDEFVTNELLHAAFGIFGDIDRSIVVVDDRGKPTGDGIVEFTRKNSAQFAIRKCNEGCFFLTANLRPVLVENYEAVDEIDGFPEKNLTKKNPDFFKNRSVGPRFAPPDSFEHEYGMRWKQLFELYSQKEASTKKELEIDQNKLVAQMEYARYEHETAMLRDQLRAREMDMDRQKREWEIKERQAEEDRQRTEETMRRQEEEMQAHMLHQEEEMRRRQQENTLFLQAHQLDNMLEQAEQSYEQPDRTYNNDGSGPNNMDPKTFLNSYERNNRYEGNERGQGMRGGHMGGRGHWGNENRGGRDDYPNKRRRY